MRLSSYSQPSLQARNTGGAWDLNESKAHFWLRSNNAESQATGPNSRPGGTEKKNNEIKSVCKRAYLAHSICVHQSKNIKGDYIFFSLLFRKEKIFYCPTTYEYETVYRCSCAWFEFSPVGKQFLLTFLCFSVSLWIFTSHIFPTHMNRRNVKMDICCVDILTRSIIMFFVCFYLFP